MKTLEEFLKENCKVSAAPPTVWLIGQNPTKIRVTSNVNAYGPKPSAVFVVDGNNLTPEESCKQS